MSLENRFAKAIKWGFSSAAGGFIAGTGLTAFIQPDTGAGHGLLMLGVPLVTGVLGVSFGAASREEKSSKPTAQANNNSEINLPSTKLD